MVNEAPTAPTELRVDRRSTERRVVSDRRNDQISDYDGPERRSESRRKVERRRQVDPTTCERDYSELEVEFMRAMDEYKRRSGRQFPTWSEVLEVIHSLGYRQVAEPHDVFEEAARRKAQAQQGT